MNDEQAIGMLSGHSDSDRFIEEYRRLSATHPDTIDALTLTGETFYQRNTGGGSLRGSGQPRAAGERGGCQFSEKTSSRQFVNRVDHPF
jgi:hypothetical protein